METVQYQLASPWKRLAALIIDSIITTAVTGVISTFLGIASIPSILSASVNDNPDPAAVMASIMPIYMGLFLTSLILGLLYYGVYQGNTNGVTLGKQLMKIRIVTEDGSEFSILKSTLRYIILTLMNSVCCLVGATVFFTARKQGIHDMIMKTVVIDESTEVLQ
jgi:uncharacterized RDD family membrane protein YckC